MREFSTFQRRLLLTSVVGLVGFVPLQAMAQDAGNETGIADIVVTAQKREQSLQDVPVAVTAVTQDTLQVNRVTNVMDLNGLAPGLSARTNAGSLASPSYTMRGVFASASVAAQDRQVSSYLDGVYVGGIRGAVFDLPDLERIEVLRGPQGTLFGRNATAGAVSIVTRDPTGEFKARQEVTAGNYDQFRTRTSVDLPQMGIFSGYFTYVHDERRGDTRNLGAGTTFDRTASITGFGVSSSPKWLGSKNSENVFAAVKIQPEADFSIVYKFDMSRTENTPEARVPVVINPNDLTGSLLIGMIAAQPAGGGAFGPIVLNPGNERPTATNNAWTQAGFVRTSGHNLTMNWQASDSISLKNVASYRRAEAVGLSSIMGISGLEYNAAAKAFYNSAAPGLGGITYAQAFDSTRAFAQRGQEPLGSYFAGYEGQSYGKYWQVSDEMQANYQSKLVTLTLGGIYFHSHELSSGVPNMAANPLFNPIASPPNFALPIGGAITKTVQRTTSYAGYGQAEIHITPKLDISLGARLTRDQKYNTFRNFGTLVGNTVVPSVVSRATFKKTKPTYSVGVNYKATDDILVYGKYSTAYLAGGTSGPLAFAPETVASWEAGLKSELLDRRLRFNLALWQATYHHSQSAQSGSAVVSTACGTGGAAAACTAYGVLVVDNGTVKAKGAEVELTVAPVQGVMLGGSFSYTDIVWKNPSPLVAQGRPVAPGSIPKYTGSVYGQYVSQPIVGDAEFMLRVDGLYTGKYRASPYLDLATVSPAIAPYAFVKGRWIVNGRAALRHINIGPSSDAELGLWVRNLTNNKDANYQLVFGNSEVNSSYQPARTWGVDVIINF